MVVLFQFQATTQDRSSYFHLQLRKTLINFTCISWTVKYCILLSNALWANQMVIGLSRADWSCRPGAATLAGWRQQAPAPAMTRAGHATYVSSDQTLVVRSQGEPCQSWLSQALINISWSEVSPCPFLSNNYQRGVLSKASLWQPSFHSVLNWQDHVIIMFIMLSGSWSISPPP